MNTVDTESNVSDQVTEVRLDTATARSALLSALTSPPAGRIPTSTYRVQFGTTVNFRDAHNLVTYLRRLGVGDLYTSPYLHAASAHGYDINDHSKVNPALGTEEEFRALLEALKKQGLGHILDVVPNHMGISTATNEWWQDVLENGQASPYATYFDIDWYPLKRALQGQVLLPILGDQYGQVLERGELQLVLRGGSFYLRYYEHELPINPKSYAMILELAREYVLGMMEEDEEPYENTYFTELESIITAISHLPEHTDTDPARIRERHREKEVIKRRIEEVLNESALVREALDRAVDVFNGEPGNPSSFDRLDDLLSQQAYRLPYWRVAAEEINYRRFFDINDLAAIRMEVPEVFTETHRLIMQLVGEGNVTGLRIDHPDGLWDPAGYFHSLQRAAVIARARADLEEEMGPLEEEECQILNETAKELDSLIARAKPLYIVAEKIVSHGEELPEQWAVHGTTGYEFLNLVGGLFVDSENERLITETYERFIGQKVDYSELVYESKIRILRFSLVSELNVLAHALNRLSERNRGYRDFTLGNLTRALLEVIAAFPVYRTYINAQTEKVEARDRAAVELAIRLARRRAPGLDPSVFDFLRNVLLLQLPGAQQEDLSLYRDFVMKFQQLTGPVMAKGLEDTAFYKFNRLVSLNEVGGEPHYFGSSVHTFHQLNLERSRNWPHRMITTSTHDTKRSEDVRARISVLSELPREWRTSLGRFSRINRSKRTIVEGERFPSRNDEYLFYQVLLGAWPLEPMDTEAHEVFTQRMVDYMIKAAREAKVHTSWIIPNEVYEEALVNFVRSVLQHDRFLEAFEPLRDTVAHYGAINSLAQVTLKFAAPGVPDLYQGNESWDFSLVDPDNRRPVDYDKLSTQLEMLEREEQERDLAGLASILLTDWRDGRIKLWVTLRALKHRQAHPELYAEGGYEPLEPEGEAAEHLVAFARSREEQMVVAVVPRLLARLSYGTEEPPLGPEPWAGTLLNVPVGRYRHLFTGEIFESDGKMQLDRVFANFPVALLEREGAG